MSLREVEPRAITATPIGGLVQVGNLGGDEVAVFGDDDIKLAAHRSGHPAVADDGERVLSHWIAEQSSSGMFELVGTWVEDGDLRQGTLATGASDNYLLLTDSYLRGAIPSIGSARVHTSVGTTAVPAGNVYLFAIPLVDLELIDGNKNDIGLANNVEGMVAKWIRACDTTWSKISRGGPWHKDNAAFGVAVLNATIAAKLKHDDAKVRASAAQARDRDSSNAFATRKRTTYEFATP